MQRLLGGYDTDTDRNPSHSDFIFVSAAPQQGRLIHAQIRYNHA